MSVGAGFRALTVEPGLLHSLLEASDYLDEEILERARRREPFVLDEEVQQEDEELREA